jgi:hypothetical protein
LRAAAPLEIQARQHFAGSASRPENSISIRQQSSMALSSFQASGKSRGLIAAGALFLGLGGSASAATFTVSNTNNAGAGSLRQAILDANSTPGADIIVFTLSLPATITPTTAALPAITDTVDIQGPGADLLTITDRATQNERAFTIGTRAGAGGGFAPLTTPNNVQISGLTINRAGALGGGVRNDTGTNAVISDCVIVGTRIQSTGGGGAIFNTGTLTVTGSTINDNIINSTAGNGGGGVTNGVVTPADLPGTITLTNCTISGNTATGSNAGGGGGIRNLNGSITLASCTVTLNTSSGSFSGGGGILNDSGAGTLTLSNTIVANNTGGASPDVSGNFASGGFNLIGNGDGGSFTGTTTGNQIGTTVLPHRRGAGYSVPQWRNNPHAQPLAGQPPLLTRATQRWRSISAAGLARSTAAPA